MASMEKSITNILRTERSVRACLEDLTDREKLSLLLRVFVSIGFEEENQSSAYLMLNGAAAGFEQEVRDRHEQP